MTREEDWLFLRDFLDPKKAIEMDRADGLFLDLDEEKKTKTQESLCSKEELKAMTDFLTSKEE